MKYIHTDLEGIDCESCGYSYDSLEIEEVGPGSYDVQYRAGCYGGDGVQNVSYPDALSFLEMIKGCRRGVDRDDIEHLIQNFKAGRWDETEEEA